jgi:hypothetical protein
MQEPLPLLLLLALLVAVVFVMVQSWRLGRQREIAEQQRQIASKNEAAALREQDRQVAATQRAARAVAGEGSAPGLLGRAGYDVIDRQVVGSWTVRANGAPETFGLRADYLVARDGRRYIAEVKTGRMAPSLSHGATRRQLLEYGAAFDVDGVLLVDADRETITHVEIDLFARNASPIQVGESSAAPSVITRTGASLVFGIAVASFAIGVLVGAVISR